MASAKGTTSTTTCIRGLATVPCPAPWYHPKHQRGFTVQRQIALKGLMAAVLAVGICSCSSGSDASGSGLDSGGFLDAGGDIGIKNSDGGEQDAGVCDASVWCNFQYAGCCISDSGKPSTCVNGEPVCPPDTFPLSQCPCWNIYDAGQFSRDGGEDAAGDGGDGGEDAGLDGGPDGGPDAGLDASTPENYFPRLIGRVNIDGDHLLSVFETDDGGLVGAGVSDVGAPNRIWPLWLLRLDANGNTRWDKWYSEGDVCQGSAIVAAPGGGYYIAGVVRTTRYQPSDVFLLNVDSVGTILWQRRFGGQTDMDVVGAVKTKDGGIIMVGTVSGQTPVGDDVFVMKLSAAGDLVWAQTYGGSASDDAVAVAETTDDSIIVAATTSSFGAVGRDLWVLKIAVDGSVVWEETLGTSGDDLAASVAVASDGKVLVGGWSATDKTGFLLALDGDGAFRDGVTFGTKSSFPNSIVPMADGGAIVGGLINNGGPMADALIFRVNTSGGLIWQKAFGGTGDDDFNLVVPMKDGSIMTVGATGSFGNDGVDTWLIKMDLTGGLIGQCSTSFERSATLDSQPLSVSVTATHATITTLTEKQMSLTEHADPATNTAQCQSP